jgi:hypothetical protein
MKGLLNLLCLFFIHPDFKFGGLTISTPQVFYASGNVASRGYPFLIFPVISNTSHNHSCLQLLRATSQEWLAGVRGGGQGINYEVRVRITTDKKVEFDSMWVSGKKLVIKVAEQLKDPAIRLLNNDEISLVASFYSEPSNKGQGKEQYSPPSSIDTIKAPIHYKGAAIIKYSVAESIKYLEVPFFKVLPKMVGQ